MDCIRIVGTDRFAVFGVNAAVDPQNHFESVGVESPLLFHNLDLHLALALGYFWPGQVDALFHLGQTMAFDCSSREMRGYSFVHLQD